MKITLLRTLCLILVALPLVGCDKGGGENAAGEEPKVEADGAATPGAAADAAAADAASAEEQPAASGPVEQGELIVTHDGAPAPGPFYGVAQINPSNGQYTLTFSDTPLECGTFKDTLSDYEAIKTLFHVVVSPAMKPDGSMTWSLASMSHGSGAVVTDALTPMASFDVKDDVVTGALIMPIAREDSEKGALEVGGAFSTPVCTDHPVPAMSGKSPVEVTSDVVMNLATRTFPIKGATTLPTPDGEGIDIRLTSEPHGCDLFVRDDFVVSIKVRGDEKTVSLGGTWLNSSVYVPVEETLSVEVGEETEEAVTITFDGQMDVDTRNESGLIYPLSLKGTVEAKRCEAP